MTDSVIEAFQKEWNDFKQTNDQRLAKLENNQATADLDEKLEKQNTTLNDVQKKLEQRETQNTELEERLDQLEVRGNRPHSAGGHSPEAEAYRESFTQDFMRQGQDAELKVKAGNISSGSDGGYAVPETLDNQILQLMRDESPMRQLATVVSISNEKYKQIVNASGASAGWVGEMDTRPETDSPKLAEFTPAFGELYANPAATQTALDDLFFDVEAWYASEIAQAFTEKEGHAFITGNGSNKPKGLLAYAQSDQKDTVRPYGTIQFKESHDAGKITADDLIDLIYQLKAGYRQNARWLLNSETLSMVRKLKDTQNNYLWQPSVQMGQPSLLLGYPVSEEEGMAQVATGAIPVAFGDMKRTYRILDVRGIRTLRDPFTNKPYVHFYTTKRVGGGVANTQSVKLLKVA